LKNIFDVTSMLQGVISSVTLGLYL